MFGSRPQLHKDKIAISRRHKIYQGKKRTLYLGQDPGTYVMHYNHNDQGMVSARGVINNRLCEMFMTRLGDIGISTHFLKRLNMRESLVRVADPLRFSVVLHNAATASFSAYLGIEEGPMLLEMIPEFQMNRPDGSALVVSDKHLLALGLINTEECDFIFETVQRINDFLRGQFLAIGMRLLRVKLEFGRIYMSEFDDMGEIILINDISLDNCHLLDLKTNKMLDPENFSETDDSSIDFCHAIAHRFGLLDQGGPADLGDALCLS